MKIEKLLDLGTIENIMETLEKYMTPSQYSTLMVSVRGELKRHYNGNCNIKVVQKLPNVIEYNKIAFDNLLAIIENNLTSRQYAALIEKINNNQGE